MDIEGRVLRFDSFSKIMSSGLRAGFVTGPTRLLRQMELHIQTSSMHMSSLSQVFLYKLLFQWGKDGLTTHFMYIKQFYKEKRDYMMRVVANHLTGIHQNSLKFHPLGLYSILTSVECRVSRMERTHRRYVLMVENHRIARYQKPGHI